MSLLATLALLLCAVPAREASAEPAIVESGWSVASRIPLSGVKGADLDPNSGVIYAVSGSTGFLLAPDGRVRSLSGLAPVRTVLAGAVPGGDIFGASTSDVIYRVGATGGRTIWSRFSSAGDHLFQALAAPPPGYTAGTVSPGQALVLDHGAGLRSHRIWRFSLETPDSETLAWTDTIYLRDPRDIAIGLGGIYIADSGGSGTGSFHRLRSDGKLVRVPLAVPIAEPVALAVDPSTGDLLVADAATGRILRLNPQSGFVTEVATGFSFPLGVAPGGTLSLSPDGSRMVVSDRGVGFVFTFCSDGCPATPICGNGIVEEGEDCDDADLVDETCPRDCLLPPGRILTEAVTDFEFPRDFGFYLRDLDHAVVSDGSLVFFWREPMNGGDDAIVSHWWTPEGQAITPPLLVREEDASGPLFSVADPRGGLMASWREDRGKKGGWVRMAQPLNGAGQTRPHEPPLIVDSGLGNSGVSAASAAWGSVLAARGSRAAIRLGREGDFMGDPFPFTTSSQSVSRVSQTGLPDGGFLIAWLLSSPGAGQSRSWARLFAADGVPTGPEFPIFDAFDVRAVEWSPLGELVAIGTTNTVWGTEIWLQRLGLDGSLIGAPVLVDTAPSLTSLDLAISPAGDLLTLWGERASRREILAARPLRFDGGPMGPSVTLWDRSNGPRVSNVKVSGLSRRLHAGRGFAASWTYSTRGFGEMIALCEDTLASCGNGVVDHACEQCDDGAGNADAVADTCRTSCTLPRCGDAVLDSGEACDDGNTESCDGCSGSCDLEPGAVCGDGIVSDLCGEACDDGNLLVGDGCSSGCTLERIVGKPKSNSCILEFVVNNPTNVPYLDRKGSISSKQICNDNDPRCDLDGGEVGSCTFQIRACVNNTNVTDCSPGRFEEVEIRAPRGRASGRQAHKAAANAAISSELFALLGSEDSNLCTNLIDVKLPLSGRKRTGSGRLNFRIFSYSDDRRDMDKLKLTCVPSATPRKPASFSAVWKDVLSGGCAMCHNPAQHCCDFLDFTTPEQAFADLQGLGRDECVGETRVVPGDAEASLLYKKLVNPEVCGVRMPARILFPEDFEDCSLGACLGPEETELIRRWIDSGAEFN